MAMLRRVSVGLLVALVAVGGAVALSVPVDRWVQRDRVASLANVELAGPDGPLLAYLVRPEVGAVPRPVVVLLHEFWGLDEATIGKADLLAAEGYVVIVPDLMRGRSTRWLASAIWQTLRTPDERVRADLDAVVAAFAGHAEVDGSRLAVAGFCFGGRMALRFALERPVVRVTGVFYGNVGDDAEALRRLGGPVIGVFGERDGSIPLREVAAFERALGDAGVTHEVHVFEGVGHAFVTGPEGIAGDPVQAEAWRRFVDFLARHL